VTALVLGATGATGRLLVQELLERGHRVRVIVRAPDKLPEAITRHENVSVIQASVLNLTDAEMTEHAGGCDAVASCLGHNVTLKGLFGHPRLLVADTTRRFCDAIRSTRTREPTRFVLMNTAGNRNPDRDEKLSIGERVVLGVLRLLLPPQVDNEKAAEYLRVHLGREDSIVEWAAVRPDTLVDEATVTDYEVHPSPTRSALFDPGKTSRANVAHFMADLMTDDGAWSQWKGEMPVIYNRVVQAT